MKVLVIGLGSIGSRHVKNLKKLGITNISILRKRNLPTSDLLSSVKYFSSFSEAIKNKPNIIVIANPTSMHMDYLQKAIRNNCHVYLEKPISHNLDGINSLIKLQNEKKKIVQIGCQLRCHPQLLKIKQWIKNKTFGSTHSVLADVGEYLPGWHPWEDYRISYASRKDQGGGVILTMIHEIDYLYWIFGKINLVSSIGGNLSPLEIDVEDTALISMKSEKGIPIHLRMDYWRKPPVRTLNIICDNAEIFWDYHKGELFLIKNGVKKLENKLPKNWDRNELFLDMMSNFLEAIKSNNNVCSPLNDGIDVLKLAVNARNMI